MKLTKITPLLGINGRKLFEVMEKNIFKKLVQKEEDSFKISILCINPFLCIILLNRNNHKSYQDYKPQLHSDPVTAVLKMDFAENF